MVVTFYKSETTGSQFRSNLDRADNKNHILRIEDKDAKYQDFLPSWNTVEHYPPYEEIDVEDRAKYADRDYPNLLPKDRLRSGEIKIKLITPKIGTEIHGVQLSTLSNKAKDELALLSSIRGVVVFRNQDFANLGPQKVKDWHKYYGPLHIHPTSGQVENHPEIHLVYRRSNDETMKNYFKNNLNSTSFHSDNSYEINPLSYTSLTMLESPETGGDTLFVDMQEAYSRLSPKFKQLLEGLQAAHSSVDQIRASRSFGGVARREGVTTLHPLIRTHPITGEKSLFLNQQFTRKIALLKEEESDAILKILFGHINLSTDFSVRLGWEENTTVFWDNRRLVHTAISDWDGTNRRHAFRLGARGEKPV